MTPQNPNQAFAHLAFLLSEAVAAEQLGLRWAVLSHLEVIARLAAEEADALLDELRQELGDERATSFDS